MFFLQFNGIIILVVYFGMYFNMNFIYLEDEKRNDFFMMINLENICYVFVYDIEYNC